MFASISRHRCIIDHTVQVVAQTHRKQAFDDVKRGLNPGPNNSIVGHLDDSKSPSNSEYHETEATMKRILVIAGSDSSGGA